MTVMGLLLATGISAAWPAMAQGNYRVQTMNFDLWCQETVNLPVDRCDKRTPEDIATFEAYRAKIERYEIPYLQQKDNAIRLDRNILHSDPVDNPISKDPSQQRQDSNQGPRMPPP